MTAIEPEVRPELDEFESLASAVDLALSRLDELDDHAADRARELKGAVESFHRLALVRVVRTLRDDPDGKRLLFELVDDPAVRAVFALHGIIRADPVTRAERALDGVRPYLRSHGGDVELIGVGDGVARVRLLGSCNGCSMSAVTLRDEVTAALVAGVDEIEHVEVLDDEPTAAFIPLEAVGRKRDTGWVRGPAVDEVPRDGMVRVDVTPSGADAEPRSFVVVRVDQRISVFVNACVHQGMTLDGGVLDDGRLVCPWHGFSFDASSGECLSAPGAQLQQVPTRVEDGHVWIRARDDG